MRFPASASPIGGLSLATLALRHPRIVDNGIRIDRIPASAWLVLQAAALWPTWRWMAARMRDGSDDPLGLLAIAALTVLVWTVRRELRATPRLGWLMLASFGTMAASVLGSKNGDGAMLTPLAAGLIAVLAWSCGLLAFLPRRTAAFPVVGLAVLALPLLSSLQFYAGYPLRVVTAEASRWLLMPGFDVTREGSTLVVDGLQVIVDAPCSGVQMVWLGYFTACVVSLGVHRGDRSFIARLPVVGLSVLAGNIVRNSVLVGFEGAGQPLAPWAHDVWGLALLAAVCGSIGWTMTWNATPREVRRRTSSGGFLLQNRFVDRVAHKALFAVAMTLSLVGGFAGAASSAASAPPPGGRFNEWPAAWDGSPLRPMALTDVEHRFAQQFPGAIARMTDGERMFVLRRVDAPTRMLHPAVDCYRALGYSIAHARLERDAQARIWRCLSVAKRQAGEQGQTLRVCERIVDADGTAFTDTSAWYWAAAGGRSQGPWQAVTRVEPEAPV